MRRLTYLLPILLVSMDAGAQIIRPKFGIQPPSAWVSAGAALQQAWTVTDGTTGSRWEFGSATTYGGALEKTTSSGVAVGIRGSTGVVPLSYVGPAATSDANARVSQLFGTIRMANGQGFHSVLELSAGATNYSEFRSQTGNLQLAPLTGDTDFSFAFGYGFGYSFSPRVSIDVVQDVTTSVHQKDGLSPSDDSTVRLHATRILGRIGLGGRR